MNLFLIKLKFGCKGIALHPNNEENQSIRINQELTKLICAECQYIISFNQNLTTSYP